jgi:hypothetical protein
MKSRWYDIESGGHGGGGGEMVFGDRWGAQGNL